MLDERVLTFLKADELGSFSAVAKALSLTQPAVSHHISGLEDELGVSLFVRKKGGIELTEQGKTVKKYANRMRAIEDGTAPRIPQDHGAATYVTMLDKSACPIDWDRSPREVLKWICGLQPWPVATMELEGKTYRVFDAEYSYRQTDKAPGSVVSAGEQGIEMACAGGETLFVTELQAPGKKRMRAADFLRGHALRLS